MPMSHWESLKFCIASEGYEDYNSGISTISEDTFQIITLYLRFYEIHSIY